MAISSTAKSDDHQSAGEPPITEVFSTEWVLAPAADGTEFRANSAGSDDGDIEPPMARLDTRLA
jgi:hypothetical protein